MSRWTATEDALLASLHAANSQLSNAAVAKLFCEQNAEHERTHKAVEMRLWDKFGASGAKRARATNDKQPPAPTSHRKPRIFPNSVKHDQIPPATESDDESSSEDELGGDGQLNQQTTSSDAASTARSFARSPAPSVAPSQPSAAANANAQKWEAAQIKLIAMQERLIDMQQKLADSQKGR